MKANLSGTETVAFFLLGVLIYLLLTVAVWGLWSTVVPYFWPAGPEEITSPPFWMFAGALFLINMVLRFVGLKK